MGGDDDHAAGRCENAPDLTQEGTQRLCVLDNVGDDDAIERGVGQRQRCFIRERDDVGGLAGTRWRRPRSGARAITSFVASVRWTPAMRGHVLRPQRSQRAPSRTSMLAPKGGMWRHVVDAVGVNMASTSRRSSWPRE